MEFSLSISFCCLANYQYSYLTLNHYFSYCYQNNFADASYSSNSSFLWLFFIPIFSSYLPLYQEFHQHLYCLPNYYQNFLLQRIIHDSPQHFMVQNLVEKLRQPNTNPGHLHILLVQHFNYFLLLPFHISYLQHYFK